MRPRHVLPLVLVVLVALLGNPPAVVVLRAVHRGPTAVRAHHPPKRATRYRTGR